MQPTTYLLIQAGVLLAVAAWIVVLARGGRPIGTLAVAVGAALAAAGVAWIAIVRSGSAELPGFIVRALVIASFVFAAILLTAVSVAALLMARLSSRPRASLHWAMAVGVGLLAWPLAVGARDRIGPEMINAVDDGSGTAHTVMHPTPEERMAFARTLPACSVPTISPVARRGWRWQALRPIAAELPMPAGMKEEPDQVPDDPGVQQWGLSRWGSIEIMLDGNAQLSTGFFIGSAAGTSEPPCSLRINSHVTLIRRSAFALRGKSGRGPDSMFVATTDIPLALPDSQLGVGITARSRAGRDSLLSLLAAFRLRGRPIERSGLRPAELVR